MHLPPPARLRHPNSIHPIPISLQIVVLYLQPLNKGRRIERRPELPQLDALQVGPPRALHRVAAHALVQRIYVQSRVGVIHAIYLVIVSTRKIDYIQAS